MSQHNAEPEAVDLLMEVHSLSPFHSPPSPVAELSCVTVGLSPG